MFKEMSATSGGVGDVRKVVDEAIKLKRSIARYVVTHHNPA